jgi:hypothetical protein
MVEAALVAPMVIGALMFFLSLLIQAAIHVKLWLGVGFFVINAQPTAYTTTVDSTNGTLNTTVAALLPQQADQYLAEVASSFLNILPRTGFPAGGTNFSIALNLVYLDIDPMTGQVTDASSGGPATYYTTAGSVAFPVWNLQQVGSKPCMSNSDPTYYPTQLRNLIGKKLGKLDPTPNSGGGYTKRAGKILYQAAGTSSFLNSRAIVFGLLCGEYGYFPWLPPAVEEIVFIPSSL